MLYALNKVGFHYSRFLVNATLRFVFPVIPYCDNTECRWPHICHQAIDPGSRQRQYAVRHVQWPAHTRTRLAGKIFHRSRRHVFWTHPELSTGQSNTAASRGGREGTFYSIRAASSEYHSKTTRIASKAACFQLR